MNQGPITTPQSKIENAMALFALAARFAEACQSGTIRPECVSREVRIETGEAGVRIEPEHYTKEKLRDESYNLMLAALGNSALVVDEALDQKYGSKNPCDTSSLGSARATLYQIRNAFAHEPLSPTWVIKEKYRRPYKVQLCGTPLGFDGAALHGKKVKPEDFGGLEGYIQLLKYLHGQVSH